MSLCHFHYVIMLLCHFHYVIMLLCHIQGKNNLQLHEFMSSALLLRTIFLGVGLVDLPVLEGGCSHYYDNRSSRDLF